jgi:hypothetical protein
MTGTLITVNRARHALAVSIGWGRPDTDPAGLGIALGVARELHGATAQEAATDRAPEVAAPPRPAARRKPRARVRG